MIEKNRYIYLCKECALFECDLEELKHNRVKLNK